MNYIATKTGERKTRDLNGITYIKDETKERWKSYFDQLSNGSHTRNQSEPSKTQLRKETLWLFKDLE